MSSTGPSGSRPSSNAPRPAVVGEEREHLESERDFLLTSLADLEREHDAGDLDEGDFVRLRDDYTSRAADVIRSLDALESRSRAAASGRASAARSGRGASEGKAAGGQRGADRRSTWRWAVVVSFIAVLAGVLVVQAAGDRGSGGVSGNIRQSSTALLADARDAFAGGDSERALRLYDEVLAQSPTNLEALTYKAWVGRNSGDLTDDEALVLLDEALAVNPAHPDAMVFRAIVLDALGRYVDAAEQLMGIGADAVPTYMVQTVTGFGVNLAGALAGEGNPAVANEVLDHVLDLDPSNVTALATKGALLTAVAEVAEGDDREQIAASALAAMDKAVAAAEDRPGELPAALLARAEVRIRLGDSTGALADLDRLEEMGVPDELARRVATIRSSLG